jgi:hypothetical protein
VRRFWPLPTIPAVPRAAPPSSVTLEHLVSIHHRVTYTLDGISVPSSGSIDHSFDGTPDSRGGIRSMVKLNSHLIKLADTINHCPCSLHRCQGGTDTRGYSVTDIRLLQTRQGHLPGDLRRCFRYRNGAPLVVKNTKKVQGFRVVFFALLRRYVDMFPSGGPNCLRTAYRSQGSAFVTICVDLDAPWPSFQHTPSAANLQSDEKALLCVAALGAPGHAHRAPLTSMPCRDGERHGTVIYPRHVRLADLQSGVASRPFL